jgi:hypothetical protein
MLGNTPKGSTYRTATLYSNGIYSNELARKMLKVETLAIALCVFMLAGLAMYALDILNMPGANHLIQQASAIRSSHNCIGVPMVALWIDSLAMQ